MYLSKIVISGFKSFLEKTVVELERDKITVVIPTAVVKVISLTLSAGQ